MDLECKVKTGVSKEGKEYVYISVMIGTYEKKVLLQQAEKELLKLAIQKNPQR